jgi:hypothetical protein
MEFPTTPMTTRSRVVLEIASELVADKSQPYNQAKVYLRTQGKEEWPLCLFGSSTLEGIHAVVRGEAALAMINPASPLMLAYRGTGMFGAPQPVRTIGVIPSYDNYVFAVKREHGLASFEDIGRKRAPLKLSLRGHRDHWLHVMLDDIAAASGFAVADIAGWGGAVRHEGLLPFPDGPKFKALAAGEIDAIFDEASNVWIDQALANGMTILPLEEPTLHKLEAMGLSPRHDRQGELSRPARRCGDARFQRLADLRACRRARRSRDPPRPRARCAQASHPLAGRRAAAGRAHGAGSARHAAAGAAPSGGRARLARSRLPRIGAVPWPIST